MRKLNDLGHGLLPDQDVDGAQSEEAALDLIGPWLASMSHGDVVFYALTCTYTTVETGT